MRLFLPALLLLPLLLCDACTTQTTAGAGATPPTALQTFDALYANAVQAEDLVLVTSTSALNSKFISATQAKKILSVLDSVKAALDAANAAAQVGSIGAATGNLAAALGPIAILSSCLTSKPLTIAIFETCAVKLTPAVTS